MKIIVITIVNHNTGELYTPRIYKATDKNCLSIKKRKEKELMKEFCKEYNEEEFEELLIDFETHIFDLDEI